MPRNSWLSVLRWWVTARGNSPIISFPRNYRECYLRKRGGGPPRSRVSHKNCPELPVADRRSLAPRTEFVAHGALIRDYFLLHPPLTRPVADEGVVSDSVSLPGVSTIIIIIDIPRYNALSFHVCMDKIKIASRDEEGGVSLKNCVSYYYFVKILNYHPMRRKRYLRFLNY